MGRSEEKEKLRYDTISAYADTHRRGYKGERWIQRESWVKISTVASHVSILGRVRVKTKRKRKEDEEC